MLGWVDGGWDSGVFWGSYSSLSPPLALPLTAEGIWGYGEISVQSANRFASPSGEAKTFFYLPMHRRVKQINPDYFKISHNIQSVGGCVTISLDRLRSVLGQLYLQTSY